MQTSRFKSVFSKRRRHSAVDRSKELEKNITQGSYEPCLEEEDEFLYEGYGQPSNALPSRPSTSLPRHATPQSSKSPQGSAISFFEETLLASTATHTRPHTSFSGVGDAIEEFRSHLTRALSRRKRSNFSLNRSTGGEHGEYIHKYSESCPAYTVEQESAARPQTSGWLRRRLSTTAGQARPPASSIFTSPQFHFTARPSYSYDDENFTALPSFPGVESEPPKPPEKIASGAAARAAAAAQNEIIDSLRNIRLTEPKVTMDSESGVGIEVRNRGESTVEFDIPVVRQGEISIRMQNYSSNNQ